MEAKPDNKALKKNSSILGISFNFLNIDTGKFMGGIYVQNNDLANKQEARIGKRIDFGLVARFTLSSISL